MELKNRRKLLEVSQIELAKNVGVTNDYISNLERKDKTPSLSLAKKISDFLMKVAQQKNIPKELFTIENIFFTECANKTFERSDVWSR